MIIGLAGPAGSGKSTVAEFLCESREATFLGFADPMKDFCEKVFDFTDDQLWGSSDERNRPDTRFTRPDGTPLTARYALQTLGTEWGRNCDPEVWAKLGMREAAELEKDYALVVFTDCRFVNEAQAIRKVGGEVWFIEREVRSYVHQSETEMLSPEFKSLVSQTIYNTGSLEQLRADVLARLDALL